MYLVCLVCCIQGASMEYSNELFHLTLKQRKAHELNPGTQIGGKCEAKPMCWVAFWSILIEHLHSIWLSVSLLCVVFVLLNWHFPSVAPSPLLYLAMGIEMANGLRATQENYRKPEPQRLPCKAPAPGTEVASSNDGSNLGTSTKSTGFCCLGSNIPVDPHREQMQC